MSFRQRSRSPQLPREPHPPRATKAGRWPCWVPDGEGPPGRMLKTQSLLKKCPVPKRTENRQDLYATVHRQLKGRSGAGGQQVTGTRTRPRRTAGRCSAGCKGEWHADPQLQHSAWCHCCDADVRGPREGHRPAPSCPARCPRGRAEPAQGQARRPPTHHTGSRPPRWGSSGPRRTTARR